MVFLHTALVYEVLDLVLLTDTISVLLFGFFSAPNRTPLAHMEEALQHIVNRSSEMLYQLPPHEAYNPPHISIDGTNLNTVKHFTYLGSVISNDATVSKDLDNRLSKASSSFGRLFC